MDRPVLFVLAGVNGAGKSSVGGHLLRQAGLTWFNPGTFACELVAITDCGLSSPALDIARVAAGGHDIPEAKIRERWQTSLQNLITLLPHLAQLQVYDNSEQAEAGEAVPDPLPLAEMRAGKLTWPTTLDALRATPSWAKPLLEAALSTRS